MKKINYATNGTIKIRTTLNIVFSKLAIVMFLVIMLTAKNSWGQVQLVEKSTETNPIFKKSQTIIGKKSPEPLKILVSGDKWQKSQVLNSSYSNKNEEQSDAPLANRTASVTGDWNNTNTWGGKSVPVAGDNVTINSGITVTVTAAAACTSITFAAVASSSSLIINGSNSLTVSGAVSMPRPSSGQSCTINVNAGTMSIGTTLTMNSTSIGQDDIINISTGSFTVIGNVSAANTTGGCQINLNSTGNIYFGGNFSANEPTLTTVSGSTVNYNRTGNQTVLNVNYNGNLIFAGSGTKTMGNGTTSIGGDITLNGTSTVWVFSGLTINGNVTINTGTTIDITGYSLNVSGNWTNNGGTLISYTSPYPSTITFNGSGAQTINGTTSIQTFYNIKVKKSAGIITTGGSTTTLNIDGLTMIQGTFTLPATLNITSNISQVGGALNAGATINVGKHWYVFGGTFNHNNGTVTFNGVLPQNICGNITFNNIATSIPGVVNIDAGNIYKTGFEGSISDWLWSYVSGSTPIYLENNGTNPTCTPSEGTQMIVFNSYYIYDGSPGDQSRFFLTSPFSTYGKTGINVAFDWYEDNGYPANNDRVTMQYSTDGSTWTNVTTYSRYNAVTGWKTKICSLPIAAENQVELYIAFLFTSEWGNNCHIDNIKVMGSPITPSTITVDNTLNLTNGKYTIGNNLLVLNGDVNGSNLLVGGTTSNLTISGTSTNLTLPSITNGLNNFTITRPNGATIRYDRNLIVTGTLSNTQGTGGLTLQSTADGTASLLHNTDNVNATIERYVTGSTDLGAKRYHMVSIPLTPASNNFSIIFLDSYLFNFDESINNWHGLGAPIDTPLDETSGYMTYAPVDGTTYYFSGPMNNGNFTTTTNATPPYNDNNHGWNLVPNPYPSIIDWKATSGWTKTNLDAAYYTWNASKAQYAAYSPSIPDSTNGATRFISIGQAFFVHANAASPVFSMNNNVRLHKAQAFLKNGEGITTNAIKIKALTAISSDETSIHFFEDATDDYDSNFDALKLYGNEEMPQLSTLISDGTKLSINSLPFSTGEKIIPLNFSLNTASEVTFTATGQENFTMMPPIYLEDLVENTVIDLQRQPEYTFTYQPGQTNRFQLRFFDITATQNQQKIDGTVFYGNRKLNIEAPSMEGQKAVVNTFDVAGRLLNSTGITLNGIVQIGAPTSTGVYIVRVISGSKIFTQKVVVN